MHHRSHSPYDIAMPKDTYQKNVNTSWSVMDGVIVKVQRSEPLWQSLISSQSGILKGDFALTLHYSPGVVRSGVVRSTRSIETEDKFWMVLGIVRKTYVCSKLLCVCVCFFFLKSLIVW